LQQSRRCGCAYMIGHLAPDRTRDRPEGLNPRTLRTGARTLRHVDWFRKSLFVACCPRVSHSDVRPTRRLHPPRPPRRLMSSAEHAFTGTWRFEHEGRAGEENVGNLTISISESEVMAVVSAGIAGHEGRPQIRSASSATPLRDCGLAAPRSSALRLLRPARCARAMTVAAVSGPI
jgi:hypothetical protein